MPVGTVMDQRCSAARRDIEGSPEQAPDNLRFKEGILNMIRSLTPQQAARNALAAEFEERRRRGAEILGEKRAWGYLHCPTDPQLHHVPSIHVAPLRLAWVRFALRRSAWNRSTPVKFAPLRFAPYNIVLFKFAPLKFAPLRFAPLNSAPYRFALLRLTPARFALLRSHSRHWLVVFNIRR